jgi:hypothetical protein
VGMSPAEAIAKALADGSAVVTSKVNVAALNPGGATRIEAPGLTQTERQFQDEVIDYAHLMGYKVAHFRTVRVQRADGSCYYCTPAVADGEGWVDLVICKPPKIFFVELKVGRNKPTEAQLMWHDLLERCGLDVGVLYPEHWEEFRGNLT